MFSSFTSANRPANLRLLPGELLTFTPTHPLSLHLRSGVLWVTQADDDRDHFLKANESMQLAPRRITVLQAQVDPVQAFLATAGMDSAMKRLWRLLSKPWRTAPQFST
jgi:Protein of unknown function (DUF2917)